MPTRRRPNEAGPDYLKIPEISDHPEIPEAARQWGQGQGPPRERATAKAERSEAPCRGDNSRFTLQLGAFRRTHLGFAEKAFGGMERRGL